MHATLTTRLLSSKQALANTRVDHRPSVALEDGEALLRIDRFALTTNNITYAAFGDSMQYWKFFPTDDPAWGQMPVWGFADVVATRTPGIEVGERFFGYFPIASHLRVQPGRVNTRGFVDVAPHRDALVSAYNRYTRCSADPFYSAGREAHLALMVPLFLTAYMLADFLRDNAFFGARRILISSASSKTAYGTAFCLQKEPGLELIGLTSPGNREFVDGLGCYTSTCAYDALDRLPTDEPALYVDFSGDETLREAVHRHYGTQLRYSCFAGSAQSTEVPSARDLPGPKPTFFFAPTQIRKRNTEWGAEQLGARFGHTMHTFFEWLDHHGNTGLQLIEHHGFEATAQVIASLHAGSARPEHGHIVTL